MDEIIEGVEFSEVCHNRYRRKGIHFIGLSYITKSIIDDYELKHVKYNYKIYELIEKIKKIENLEICYSGYNMDFNNKLEYLINNLPENIINLRISNHNTNQSVTINKLPSNLKLLQLYIKVINPLTKMNLPPNLETLMIYGDYDFDFDDLPENLKVLKLGAKINCKLDNLPNSLTTIILENSRLKDVNLNNLPDSVEHIGIFRNYNVKIEKLPKKLKKIDFNDRMDIKYKYYDELKDLCKDKNIIIPSEVHLGIL